jgi:hypothetical protein
MYLKAVATLTLDARVGYDSGDTAAGATLDFNKYFVNPGKRPMKAVLLAGLTSTDSGLFDYKLQDANTTVDSDFADISGATFTQIGSSGTLAAQDIEFYTNKRYVRGTGTIAGGTWFVAATVYAVKRDA